MSKKSEKLTRDEYRALKKYVSGFESKDMCAFVLGFSRLTLYNVLARKSGKPETLNKIRAAIYL